MTVSLWEAAPLRSTPPASQCSGPPSLISDRSDAECIGDVDIDLLVTTAQISFELFVRTTFIPCFLVV